MSESLHLRVSLSNAKGQRPKFGMLEVKLSEYGKELVVRRLVGARRRQFEASKRALVKLKAMLQDRNAPFEMMTIGEGEVETGMRIRLEEPMSK